MQKNQDRYVPDVTEAKRESFKQNFQSSADGHIDVIKEFKEGYEGIMLPDWLSWNELMGGFRPREFTIFCGSTGAGKTQFIASMSAQLIKQEIRHFVMNVETGKNDFLRRVVSCASKKNYNDGRKLTDQEIINYHNDGVNLMCKNYLMLSRYEDRTDCFSMMDDLLIANKDFGAKIAFIDNLNFFLDVSSDANSVSEMDRVVHELTIFCKKIDMHIVMVMHPKKPPQSTDTRVYSEMDIKGSSTAIQCATNVLLWNRPKADDVKVGKRDMNDRELRFVKVRKRGSSVGRTLVFGFENQSFIEKQNVSSFE